MSARETLRQVGLHTFEAADGGSEPLYQRCTGDGGRIEYWHESGYGCLLDEHVEIVEGTPS